MDILKTRGYPNIITFDIEKGWNKIWSKNLVDEEKLIITNLNCVDKTEDLPMHFKINFDVEKLLNSFGLFGSKVYDWL